MKKGETEVCENIDKYGEGTANFASNAIEVFTTGGEINYEKI